MFAAGSSITTRSYFLGLSLLLLVSCGGGGGGGDDQPPPPATGPIPAVSGTYAFDSAAVQTSCSDGGAVTGPEIHHYIEVTQSGSQLALARDFVPQYPGFNIVSSSGLSGSVAADRQFSASGQAIMEAADLSGRLTVDYTLSGQFADAGWSGEYSAEVLYPNGTGCTGRAGFDGASGAPSGLGGIWKGLVLFADGQSVESIGFSTEDGELRFANLAGEQTLGTFTVVGTEASASIVNYAPSGSTYPNGQTQVIGNAQGNFRTRSSIQGSSRIQGEITSTFSFSYDPVYDRAPSLAAVAGSYSRQSGSYTETYTVDTGGVLTGGNSQGCLYRGTVSMLDARYNLYRLAVTVSACAELDGSYSGLAAMGDWGGASNDSLAYSVTGPRWILSGTVLRNSSNPNPEPPKPEPPKPEPPKPEPPFDDLDRDGNTSFETARPVIDSGEFVDTVDSLRDGDLFVFTAAETASYSVTLEFSNPDIYLYWYNNNENRTLVGESRKGGVTRQAITNKRLEKGKLYYLGVQATSGAGAQNYRVKLERKADTPQPFPNGTALYSHNLDASGKLLNPVPLQGARLQRKTVYFSYAGSYKQVSFWCCKVVGGNEGHAPRFDDTAAPFIHEVDLTLLSNEGGLPRELYADFFYPGGGFKGDNTVTWTLERGPEPSRYSVSGSINVAGNTFTDRDVNDPAAPYTANDSFAQAQELPNPVVLNGFVSSAPTGQPGDRFTASADTADVYRISLLAGQLVWLQNADYDPDIPSRHDVDLYLFDVAGKLLAASNGSKEFESVIAPASGVAFIRVEAGSGVNKYVLHVGEDFTSGRAGARNHSADFVPGELLVRYREDSRFLSADGIDSRVLLSSQQGVATRSADGEVHLVQFEDIQGISQLLQALGEPSGGGLQSMRGAASGQVENDKYLTLKLIKQLGQRRDVAYAEPNYNVQPSLEPNDDLYYRQWHYPFINLPGAWSVVQSGSYSNRPIVAVVDTGVLLRHPDFGGQLTSGYDFISDPYTAADGDGIDPNPDDVGDRDGPSHSSSFHGTHVAGTIAARSNNSQGAAGIAWGARIMPIRVLGIGGGTGYDVQQGIRYAARLSNDSGRVPDKRADIINLSIGCGACYSQSMQDTLRQVRGAGVIVVAAAGNRSSSEKHFPAAYDGVVAVSALGSGSERAYYSNYGGYIDVSAPGGDGSDRDGDGYSDRVLSTLGDDSSGSVVFRYGWAIGTSMASPHVAGVAALMKTIYPGLTPQQFDEALRSGAAVTDLGSPGRDNIFGHGMIDALKAVKAAQKLGGEPVEGTITATPTVMDFPHGSSSGVLLLSADSSSVPSVSSVVADQSWLSVSPAGPLEGKGLGQYRVTVNRAGLATAIHQGLITVYLDNGKTLEVPVNLQVLDRPSGSGDPGLFYVLLRDANTQAVFYQAEVRRDTAGNFIYNFHKQVAAGIYRVYAGSDIDNDGEFCGAGESCGSWPTQHDAQEVNVDRDLGGLDFELVIDTDFGT